MGTSRLGCEASTRSSSCPSPPSRWKLQGWGGGGTGQDIQHLLEAGLPCLPPPCCPLPSMLHHTARRHRPHVRELPPWSVKFPLRSPPPPPPPPSSSLGPSQALRTRGRRLLYAGLAEAWVSWGISCRSPASSSPLLSGQSLGSRWVFTSASSCAVKALSWGGKAGRQGGGLPGGLGPSVPLTSRPGSPGL